MNITVSWMPGIPSVPGWWSPWGWTHLRGFRYRHRRPAVCFCVLRFFRELGPALPLWSCRGPYAVLRHRFIRSLSPFLLSRCRARCICVIVRRLSSSVWVVTRVWRLLRIWRCDQWAEYSAYYFEDDLIDDGVDLCFQHLKWALLLGGGWFLGRVGAEHSQLYNYIWCCIKQKGPFSLNKSSSTKMNI